MPAAMVSGVWSPSPGPVGGRVSPQHWAREFASPRVNSPLDIVSDAKEWISSPYASPPPLPPRRRPSLDASREPFYQNNSSSEPLLPRRLPSLTMEEFNALKRHGAESRSGSRSDSRGGSRNGSRKGRRRNTLEVRGGSNGNSSAPPTRGDPVPMTPMPDAPLTEPADRRPHSRSLLRGASSDPLLSPGDPLRKSQLRPKRSRERQGASEVEASAYPSVAASPPARNGYPTSAPTPAIGSRAQANVASVPTLPDCVSPSLAAGYARAAQRFSSHSPAVEFPTSTPAVGSRALATPVTAPAAVSRVTPGTTGASRGRSSSLARSSSVTKLSSHSTADLAQSPLVTDGRRNNISGSRERRSLHQRASEDAPHTAPAGNEKQEQLLGIQPLRQGKQPPLESKEKKDTSARSLFADSFALDEMNDFLANCQSVPINQDHDYFDRSFGSDPAANSGDSGPRNLPEFTCTRGQRGSIISLGLSVNARNQSAIFGNTANGATMLGTLSSPAALRGQFAWVKGELLGHGSLGRVYKALDQRTGEIFAVKEVRIDQKDEHDVKFKATLENEVTICQELKHPHIVSYLGHDYIDSSLYIYLEYMAGGSMAQVLSQFGPLDESLIATYSKELLQGLVYLHTREQPVLHRDIKGANILVGLDCMGSRLQAKLSDFGCSKRTADTCHTMRGSIPWMAPEVIKQTGYGLKADIWSFGCVLIEMGTAKHPWGAFDNPIAAMRKIGMSEDLPPLPQGISESYKEFISCCLQRDKTKRPSASALLSMPFVRDAVVDD